MIEREETFAQLLGGRGAALDATLPSIAFVAGWLLTNHSVGWGALIAVGVAVAVGVVRLIRGDKIRAVLVGAFVVSVAALVAMYTGRAIDFFLVQLLSNAASGLAFVVSWAVRWPLLGVIIGALLGQRTRWRQDPDLLRAYGRATLVYALQYVLRVLVFGYLWWQDDVVASGIARVALSWPLYVVMLAPTWWAFRAALPADHPGLRHPRRRLVPDTDPG
ncbi:DUF3159 domain-containing protein [Kutzneria sp. CA-103260]|uniref:DUF3159 domain-containing protein n=1 Tax=Kutzneria sp. CA-103260 TaxID=2802641 RepID=UPI001BABE699|nr:DUF3159 domain-containing protein [Kutzneria sp. CA-103260]QUQ69576.1 integral membrane alanine and leucine rich protein [Kutzneria sp. CA-103260]